jgi:hypothetical protein
VSAEVKILRKLSMDSCLFADIETPFDETVASVAPTQGIDPICSTSKWILPVAQAFAPDALPRVFVGDVGYVALIEHDTPNGPVLTSFDAVWGFATPFIGTDPTALVIDIALLLRRLDFYALTVSGLDPAGPLFDEVQQLGPAGFTDTADRCVADLTDGFDAWLGRRSTRFRRSLRAAVNRGEATGVELEHLKPTTSADVDAAFERLLTVERTSWKTDAGSGLVDTTLGEFTRAMAHGFAATGALRVQFARLDGSDVGYVIGARIGDRYRGFQHSFNKDLPELSIGKLLQFHTIAEVQSEGVRIYDMGMHMSYKESYADRIESTVTAIIPKRP